MWIASKLGFFSVVAHKSEPETTQIRARVRQDLVNLLAHHGRSKKGQATPIIETLDSDYRFRIIVPKKTATKMVEEMARDIDYPNFKTAIAGLPDQREKLHAYHEIWHSMARLQP